MLKISKPKKQFIYFDTDDDFYKFCVVPSVIVNEDEMSYDFDLSPAYYNALADDKYFVIKDMNSNIYKNGCVSYRTITKPVCNLEQYFGDEKYGN